MQWHRGSYTIDTDRERLDLDTVARWLNTTYWAADRSREAIDRSWNGSAVVFGLYAEQELAGWARVVTDRVTTAYLADVFLLPEHRGKGLGLWLVETIVGHPELATVNWLLHTKDAHRLYERVGFSTDTGPRLMQRRRTLDAQ
jgi:GNAT superfamily N-acetyltransferase